MLSVPPYAGEGRAARIFYRRTGNLLGRTVRSLPGAEAGCDPHRPPTELTAAGRKQWILRLPSHSIPGAPPLAAGFPDIGMLAPGYRADFAVLSDDLLRIPPEEIDQVQVDETYISGECVYRRDK